MAAAGRARTLPHHPHRLSNLPKLHFPRLLPSFYSPSLVLPILLPILLLLLLLHQPPLASATCDQLALYDATYATRAAGKGAAEVRAWLHDRASAHHSPKSYSQAYDLLEAIDAHNATHVRVIYGGVDAKCRVGAFAGRSCEWNREHLWPQSYGVGESAGLTAGAPPRTDMHALVPSRAALNSARSNRAFAQITADDAAGTCAAGYTGCESPVCTPTTCGSVGSAQSGSEWWTPPATYRGFVARALFYMAVRYDGVDADTYDLRLGDALDRDTGGSGTYTFGLLSHLLKWHVEHPVEAWEKARNDAVCASQGNRNPFVDKPELVAVVFNASGVAAKSPPAASSSSSPTSPGDDGAIVTARTPWINEIHYDDEGQDAGEFVEVALPLGVGGYAASDVSVTLYNGNNGAPYWGPTPLSRAPFTKGATVGGGSVVLYTAAISGIQNGAPDGVALSVRGVNGGAAIQFLSYEGVIVAGVGGAANGMKSKDVGVAEGGTTAEGTSLSLTGVGSDYGAFRWSSGVAATPGALNAGQTVVAPPPPPPSLSPSSTSSSSSSSPPPYVVKDAESSARGCKTTGAGGGSYTFAVVAGLAVMWVLYIAGLFRYFI